TSVLFGEWLRPGMHINSVGTARRDQRELDPATFQRCDRIILDTRRGVLEEAGDVVAARDQIPDERLADLAELVGGKVKGRCSDAEITLFKSVGTGIQDLALAQTIYAKARKLGAGSDIGSFPYLKSN